MTSSENKLIVNFSRTKRCPFDIKSESSYNAYLSKGSLELAMKKSNCIAWVDIPRYQFHDHIIEAKFRLDSLGGYASAGIMFHIEDKESYYMALVSNKGYFRIDVMKDSALKHLIAWSEISDFDGTNVSLNIITYGTFLIFLVNGKWLGEVNDDSITAGRIGFVLASYEGKEPEGENEYACKAALDYLSIDTRIKTIEESYEKWADDTNINANGRLRLAETFAVMGEASKAMAQLNKAWKRRDEAIRDVAATDTEVRTKKELILAARMSSRLGQYKEAEEFLNLILEQWPDSQEGKMAYAEKLKVLDELKKFAELKEFMLKHHEEFEKNIDYFTLLARCHWELKEYGDSAAAWSQAFELNNENGVYKANAASALELARKEQEALALFIEAGKLFLKQDNLPELAAIIPKLTTLGEKNWEARALAGKWAFSNEDYDGALKAFTAANRLRCSLKPRPKADPAHYYLWGLVLSIKGRNSDAIRILERTVKLAPDYGLFRFKLAELKLTIGVENPALVDELKLALKQIEDDQDGAMANHAGNLLQKAGYGKAAKYFFDKAKK